MGGFLEAFYRFGALKGGVNLSDRCKSRVNELGNYFGALPKPGQVVVDRVL
jgi:hypothetical protein